MAQILEQKILKMLIDFGKNLDKVSNSDSALRNCEKCLDTIDSNLRETLTVVFTEFSEQTLTLLAENMLKIESRLHLAEFYINYYLSTIQSENQFAVQFRLFKAQIIAQRAKNSNVNAENKYTMIGQALNSIQSAICIIDKPENKDRLSFMIYNTSLILYQIMQDYFRSGFFELFTSLCEKLNDLLRLVESDEYNWCGQFSWILFCSIVHTDKKQEALKLLDRIWEKSKKKNYVFHEVLFRQRVVMCTTFPHTYAALQKEVAKENDYMKSVFMLQALKVGLIPENSIEKELNGLLKSLNCIRLGGEEHDVKTLSEPNQVVYAEIARVAAHYGITSLARQLTTVIKKTKNFSLKAQMITEFALAELKAVAGVEDKKLIGLQLKEQLVIQRKEAIYGLSKALKMINNVKDPWLLYEGCLLMWNLCLPFLNEAYRAFVYKPFKIAVELQEMYLTSDYNTRIKMLIELSKVEKANKNYQSAFDIISKALDLSNYISKSAFKYKLEFMQNELALFIGYKNEEWNELDKAQIQINNLNNLRHESAKRETLLSIIQSLEGIGEQTFCIMPTNMEIEQDEINNMEENHKKNQKQLHVVKISILAKACHAAFNLQMFDVMMKAAQEVIKDVWTPENQELIIQQSLCHVFMAHGFIKRLLNEGYEFAFADAIRFDSDKKYKEITPEELDELKKNLILHYEKALELAVSIKQHWLVFNGAINIWNNYLPAFKNSLNDSKLHPKIFDMLEKYFNALKEAVKEIERRKVVDYELENKTQIYGNIALIYARLLEGKKEYKEVMYVCEELLLSPLAAQTRKLVNSTRARVAGVLEVDKGNKKSKASGLVTDKKDQMLYDIISKLEIIQNVNSNQSPSQYIKDCHELLIKWREELANESNHELSCELWTKLGNFAYNEDTIEFYKLSVSCLDKALEGQNIRWMALAHLLYGKVMVKLAGPDHLLFKGLEHILEALNKALSCNNQRVFLDSLSQFCKICALIEQEHYSKENASCLVKPLFSAVYYMKLANQTFNDFRKNEEISKMSINMLRLLHKGCSAQADFEILEMASKVLLELVVAEYKKDIWMIRIHAIEKLTQNETDLLKAISECNPGLKARLLVQLAYTTEDAQKQYFGFTKAVEILRKENDSEVTAVMLELGEWMLLHGFKLEVIHEHLLSVVDLLIEKMQHKTQSPILESILHSHGQSFYGLYSRNYRGKASELLSYKEIVEEEKVTKVINDTLNIVEYDRLFRAHCMLAMISQDHHTRLSFTQDASYFLSVILRKTFEKYYNTLKTEKKSDSIEENDLPLTARGWFRLLFDNSFHEMIEYSKDIIVFCKKAFEKPCLTFHYLLNCFDVFNSEGMHYESAFLLKYIELFSRHIIDNQQALAYSYLELSHFSQLFGLNDLQKHYFTSFESLSSDLEEDFNSKLDKLKQIFEKSTVSFYNYTQEAKKKYEFKENVFEFEFWMKISKILCSYGDIDKANRYLTAFIKAVDMGSLIELEGEARLQQTVMFFNKHDIKSAEINLEKAKLCIKSLSNWHRYIETASELYIETGRTIELHTLFRKVEELIDGIDQKSCFENFSDMIKKIRQSIKLIECEIAIQNFKEFSSNYVLETSDTYKSNYERTMDNVMKNLKQLRILCGGEVNKKLLKNIKNVALMIIKVIEEVKITEIQMFKSIMIHLEEINTFLFDIHEISQRTYNHVLEIHLKLVNSIISESINASIIDEIYDLKYLWVRSLNLIFSFRSSFEDLSIQIHLINGPTITENNIKHKDDGSAILLPQEANQKTIVEIQNFMDYIINSERIINQTNMAQVFLDELSYGNKDKNLLYQDANIKLERCLLKLHRDILLIYIDEYSFENSEILNELEYKPFKNTPSDNRWNIMQSNLVSFVEPVIYLPFSQFMDLDFFDYNIKRLQLLMEINKKYLPASLIFDHQSLRYKKSLYEFFVNVSAGQNTLGYKMSNLFKYKKTNGYDELNGNEFFKYLFSINDFESGQSMIKDLSCHISIHIDDHDFRIYLAAYFKSSGGKIIEKVETIKNAGQLIQQIKDYVKYLHVVDVELPDKEIPINFVDDYFDVSTNQDDKQTNNSNPKKDSFVEFANSKVKVNTNPLTNFISSFIGSLELSQIDDDSTKPTKQKANLNSLNEIVLHIPIELANYPFESLFHQIMPQNAQITKSFSFDTYIAKLKKGGYDKISATYSFGISSPLGEFESIPEIASPIQSMNELCAKTNISEKQQEINGYHWDYAIENYNILSVTTLDLFNSKYGFAELSKFVYNSNTKLNLLILADSMKIVNDVYNSKYVDKDRDLKINRLKLILLMADMIGLQGIILPYGAFTSKELSELSRKLKIYINEGKSLSGINSQNCLHTDFSYFGIAGMVLHSNIKKNK